MRGNARECAGVNGSARALRFFVREQSSRLWVVSAHHDWHRRTSIRSTVVNSCRASLGTRHRFSSSKSRTAEHSFADRYAMR